jgi:mono/diheme cytochrome c family protein
MKHLLPSPLALAAAAALAFSPIAGCKQGSEPQRARMDKIEKEITFLRGIGPDQAKEMTYEAYHFTNLWFAIDAENWPLAGFYLNEARKNLRSAMRIMPTRKDKNGAEVNVSAIAESLQTGPMKDLDTAIEAKDKAGAVKAYKDTLTGCHGCHEAAGKGFLRPRIPTAPQVTILSFAPNAPMPE